MHQIHANYNQGSELGGYNSLIWSLLWWVKLMGNYDHRIESTNLRKSVGCGQNCKVKRNLQGPVEFALTATTATFQDFEGTRLYWTKWTQCKACTKKQAPAGWHSAPAVSYPKARAFQVRFICSFQTCLTDVSVQCGNPLIDWWSVKTVPCTVKERI